MVAAPYFSEKEWALKWLRGSIESFFRGKTSLQIVVGRIRRAVESYNVSVAEVKQIIGSLLIDPSINIPREIREEKAKELLKLVEEMKRNGRGG
jgi:hypothetical protein